MEVKRIINLIILDASGSMESIYNQALSGVNETIQTIRIGQKDHPEFQQFLTMASFNSGRDYLKVTYSTTPIGEVKELTREDYVTCGCTALYDAMGEMISELKRNVTIEDRVLVTVITDGYENASQHWSGPQIKSLVVAFEETEEGTALMFKRERQARSGFFNKIKLHVKDLGYDCLEEEDDYFDNK